MNQERAPGVFATRSRVWLLAGVLIGISLAVLAVLLVTQTRWGHRQVLEFSLRAASERLDGTLEIARLDGNLFTGARLYGISLRGPNDEPFLLADSAFVEYNLRTIAADEIVLNRIVLYSAQLYLRRMPGDTLWNYDRLFGDTIPTAEPASPRRPLVVRSASMFGGNVAIELPWEPDPTLPAAEQRREVDAALSDTAQVMVREVPGGYLRTMRISDVTAALSQVVSAPDELGGTSLSVDSFRGDLNLFREAVRIEHLQGSLAYDAGRLRFRIPDATLPASRLEGYGTIEFGHSEGARLDILFRGDTLAFRDLRAFYPRLPDQGGGSLELVIETRPEGTLYLARDVRITAPGTRLQGSFGMILNDTLRFVNVDLVADPLRVATIEQILPVELPVVGLRIGGVEIQQPAS